jgi:hypothetical protein
LYRYWRDADSFVAPAAWRNIQARTGMGEHLPWSPLVVI